MSVNRGELPGDPHLASVLQKNAMLRDRVRAVFLGYQPGALIWGAGGSGKTFTVEDEATKMGVALRRSPGVLTGRALYEKLRRHPTDIHLIEDNEQLLKKDDALTVLREATWTVERHDTVRDDGRFPDRPVAWARHNDPNTFVFSGGVIITQNEKPPPNSRVGALLSRLRPFEFSLTDSEMLSLARHLAATAPPRIMAYQMVTEECTEVLNFLTEQATRVDHPIDLRLAMHAYEFFCQFQNSDCRVDWHDHVRALVTQRPPRQFNHPVDLSGSTRAALQERDRQTVRAILAETWDAGEQLRLWQQRTGKGKSMFYERRGEVLRLQG
jgi:hypothetical protein